MSTACSHVSYPGDFRGFFMISVSHSTAVKPAPTRTKIITDYVPRARSHASTAGLIISAIGMIVVPALVAPYAILSQATAQTRYPSTTGASTGSSTLRSADGRGISGTLVGSRVTLIARPQDSNHAITAVRFLLDGNTLAEVGPPGHYVWSTRGLRLGRHVVQVQAFSGESFVGVSPPLALIVTATDSSTVVPVSFPTYGFSARRASDVVAPRLNTTPVASIPGAFQAPGTSAYGTYIEPARGLDAVGLTNSFVEVYLNGVKQEFAPAPRVASAEELDATMSQPAASQRTVQDTARTQQGSSSRVADATRRQQATASSNRSLSGQSAPRTVWMPARPLLERLGARVRWEARSKTLTADLNVAGGTRRILLSANSSGGSAYAEVNGRRMALQMPVRLTENAIMVPLTFCTEALNLRATWQKESRRVELYTPITPA
jgi:hypothetical protein